MKIGMSVSRRQTVPGSVARRVRLCRNLVVGFSCLVLGLLLPGCFPWRPQPAPATLKESAPRHEAVPAALDASPSAAHAAPAEPLSLDHAIRTALRNNPDMELALARIRQAEARQAEAAARFWPTFSLFLEYSQGDTPSAYLFKTIDQRRLPATVDFNDPGWFQNYEAGLQARVNLYAGGRDRLGRKAAAAGIRIRQLDRQAVVNTLVASVIEAYYNGLAALDFIRIAEESVRTVEAQLRAVDVRFRAGGVLKSDVLSLEVRLAQAREDLIRGRIHHQIALASLGHLLGTDREEPLALADPGSRPVAFPEAFQEGLLYALANRPDLKQVRARVIQSRLRLDAAQGEYQPRLDAQFRYTLDDPGLGFERDRENWTAALVLSWELFSGGATRARVNNAHGELQETLAADRKAAQAVRLEVKTAYLRLSEAQARLAVAQSSVMQAEASLELVRRQYEGGSATITRYLEAELARNQARTRTAAALFDRERARAAVGRALGHWAVHAGEE